MSTSSTAQVLGKNTPVRLGLVLGLAALVVTVTSGALAMFFEIQAVRNDLVPTVVRMEANLKEIAKDVGELRETMNGRPTDAQVKALIEDAVRDRFRDIAKRLLELERAK